MHPRLCNDGYVTKDEHLAELHDAVAYRDLVERMITAAVVGARSEGATWLELSRVLGVTHQAVRKRFVKLAPRGAKALVGDQAP